MLLRYCFVCDSHEIRTDDGSRQSFCCNENCWSRYSKCVARLAIQRFLEEERLDAHRTFSALSHVYGEE